MPTNGLFRLPSRNAPSPRGLWGDPIATLRLPPKSEPMVGHHGDVVTKRHQTGAMKRGLLE